MPLYAHSQAPVTSHAFNADRTQLCVSLNNDEAQQAAAKEFEPRQRQFLEAHQADIGTKDDMLSTMREQLSNVSNERDDLAAEVSKLRAELSQTRGEQSRPIQEASERDSLVLEPGSSSTSIGPMTPASINGFPPVVDTKMASKLEEQTKQIEEQEAMIKTLNKQLTHCETDLQTHMDLVNKLEASLADAEKNLRKARMQATELARERDSLNIKMDQTRNELADQAQREVVTVRRSVVEEKQSLEQRLDEERQAKQRARQQLDSRMEELQRRKNKFACL